MKLFYCKTEKQHTDILTKALLKLKFEYLRQKLGVCSQGRELLTKNDSRSKIKSQQNLSLFTVSEFVYCCYFNGNLLCNRKSDMFGEYLAILFFLIV
jgi:hypothetical protein